MSEFSIETIQTLLRKDALPQIYSIKTPLTITSEVLVKTLKLFNNDAQLRTFIDLLSTNKAVTIQVNKKQIQQGSADRFVHAYTEHSLLPAELDEKKQNQVLMHLKGYQFEFEQLNYLLKNLSYEAVNEYLLTTRCFERADLILLCNDFEKITHFSTCTIKSLYHFLNKVRQWKESVTPLLDMFYFAYRAGHVLGLSGPVVMMHGVKDYSLDTEYAPGEVSLRLLCEYVESYAQRFSSREFDAIKFALKRNVSQFFKNTSEYQNTAHVEILKQYRKGKLTFLSCGWPGHTVSVVLYGNYAIYTNRGPGGDLRYGSKIFKIKNDDDINQSFVYRLIHARSMNEFDKILARAIDFKKPIIRFYSKPQKYSNCLSTGQIV